MPNVTLHQIFSIAMPSATLCSPSVMTAAGALNGTPRVLIRQG